MKYTFYFEIVIFFFWLLLLFYSVEYNLGDCLLIQKLTVWAYGMVHTNLNCIVIVTEKIFS